MCGSVVNGRPHGPKKRPPCASLHMRHFKDGDTEFIETLPGLGSAVVKDLVVDRSALDLIIAAGVFISVNTGQAP